MLTPVNAFAGFAKSMLTVLTVLAAVALGLPLVLYVAQDSLIFYPPPAPPAPPNAPGVRVEAVRVPMADGISLAG